MDVHGSPARAFFSRANVRLRALVGRRHRLSQFALIARRRSGSTSLTPLQTADADRRLRPDRAGLRRLEVRHALRLEPAVAVPARRRARHARSALRCWRGGYRRPCGRHARSEAAAAGRQATLDRFAPKRPSLWVTRRRPKIDRVACPWLIRRFLDADARILLSIRPEVRGGREGNRRDPVRHRGRRDLARRPALLVRHHARSCSGWRASRRSRASR